MATVRDWLLTKVIDRLDRVERKLNQMAAREDAARARQEELLTLVRDAYRAKEAEVAILRAELESADADAEARVNAALEADSDFDAEKMEQGNAALEELLAPPVEPTPEPTPPSE